MAKSIMDYIFKWLAIKFLSRESQIEAGVPQRDETPEPSTPSTPQDPVTSAVGNVVPLTRDDQKFVNRLKTDPEASAGKQVGFAAPKERTTTFLYQQDAPSCGECGSIMVRNGACYKCLNCGSTSGCS